ncbi:hypothetical protein [Allorhizocola rhizosphaerae]|uniref:hypothetical protein n=1 Tax=Allorhizocola rhizosphaerae TaxID=1872709 RepID=UPI000E3CF90A|nr:hypothetical protein [Allorhizocola rhizosphaerae]
MRRLLATAALVGVALFATAACADVPQPPLGSPTGTPTTKTDGSPADKATTCAAWKTLRTDVEAKIATHRATIEGAKDDPLKAASAYGELTTLLNDYKTKTAELEAKAGDAEVKAALKDEVAAATKLQSELNAAGSDPAKIQAAIQNVNQASTNKLKSLCQ